MKSSKPGAKPSERAAAPARKPAPGESARNAAVAALAAVLHFRRAFDDAFPEAAEKFGVETRDRAFARAIAAAALRNHGSLKAVLGRFIEKPLPKDTGRLDAILLSAAAQLLILKTPPHAAISIAVDQCRTDQKARRFDKLANAVLRRVSEKGAEILAGLDATRLNIPGWLWARWSKTYGETLARDIAEASLKEAPLDLTVKSAAAGWAEKLGGITLASGTVRVHAGGRIEDLPGYAEGAWWVQDAAAALPAKLLGDVRGLRVADLCAAPGGKTAQLAWGGADVTAVDLSPDRIARLTSNLMRLDLTAETVAANITAWKPGQQFDAILVDAPCTSTGTIRRHPDILYLKRAEDVAVLAAVQARILDAAAAHLKPGGRMVYCTCSLEAEEGPEQVAAFLGRHAGFARRAIDPAVIGNLPDVLTNEGDLRTLPCHLNGLAEGLIGLDGFYAAVLERKI